MSDLRAKITEAIEHCAGPAEAAADDYAPAGVVEALQRLIENAAVLGPASRDDALLVARHRAQLLAAPVPPTEPVVPEGLALVPIDLDAHDDMTTAACDAGNLYRVDFVRAWAAAIAAAPKGGE